MNITVLGCGRWATFLGWYANHINHDVLIWGRETSENLKRLKTTRQNDYLTLSEDVILTDSLGDAIEYSDYMIVSVSSQHLRNLCGKLNQYDLSNKTLILAMKGIEKDTGYRLSQVVKDVINQNINIAIWVGPGHVQAFTQGIPNCMLISSEDIELTKKIIDIFNSDLIRLYIGEDLIGNEIGAASKNVVGIAAGMLDGVGYTSLKGSLIARGSREMSRLIKAMGGNELTVYGLCHIGDYEATLFSPYSNNRGFGEKFIKGEPFDKLAEGVSTMASLLKLAKIYSVEMPITEAIHSVINEDKNPEEVLKNLFMRDIKYEF